MLSPGRSSSEPLLAQEGPEESQAARFYPRRIAGVALASFVGCSLAAFLWRPGRREDAAATLMVRPGGNQGVMDGVVEHVPLFCEMFTADPSAHVFDGQVYVYPSHDPNEDPPPGIEDPGQFAMRDYHVFQLLGGKLHDRGISLQLEDVPWASEMLWAPDAAFKNGTYFFYFPARDKHGVFRIGVATARTPVGPFVAQAKPIYGSFSVDPCVFGDDDGRHYMYFGGLRGGQLTWYQNATERRALGPRVALLSDDMLSFAGDVHEVLVLDERGDPLRPIHEERRFFEAVWMHKYNGTYYLSYSTGTTHLLVYATGISPLGPFHYKGVLLTPVLGWTTHHSIVEVDGQWWLFYADAELSGGVSYKRNVKVARLRYTSKGHLETIDGSVAPE